MIIDEKGKIAGKISIIDIFVVLILLIAIIGCGWKFLGKGDTVRISSNDSFTTIISIDKVREDLCEYFKEGEAVYEVNGGKIGTITKVESEPYTEILPEISGIAITYTDRYTVYITLQCNGTVNDNGFYTEGGKQIYEKSSVKIQSRLFLFETATIDKVGETE